MGTSIVAKLKVSISDILLSALILVITFAFCFLIKDLDGSSVSIPMIFILAVLLISLFTSGYLWGTLSSLISVLAANYVFTYPYFEFNFSLAGYPFTMLSMLTVSVITCTLTTRIKQQEKVKLDAEIEKTRGNLLRSVSHDLRTPLTSILGASTAIMENDNIMSQNDRINLATDIKNDAQWLIQMVENLLSITKIGDGREAKITKTSESVEEVVAESIQKFCKRFPTFPLSANVPDEILMIPMDAILIEQVIINLLENSAIHAESATETELNVFLDGDFVVFEVADNGVGISPEILPHIFDGYLNKKIEDNADGKKNMGIGLSVCYTIIKAHGGTMKAKNAKPHGAIFSFTLPKEDVHNG